MKFTALLLAVLSLNAHAAGKRPLHVDPSPVTAASPFPDPSPIPGRRIRVANIVGATPDEREMIRMGESLANAMLDKPCFKEWVLAADYTENDGLTQAQIFDKVTSIPSSINVEMYTGSYKANYIYKTVGYENDPFDGTVHMNRHFVDTPEMVADNLIHEDRGHSLGFHHYGNHSSSEPYGMNYAFEGCSQAQQQQMRGGKSFKPPGLRLEIRRAAAPKVIARSGSK